MTVIQFYKNQADRCDLEARNHDREAEVYEGKAAHEMKHGTGAQAMDYARLADTCRAEAVLARKEAENYRNAVENWNN